MGVKFINATTDGEALISFCARVSNPGNQDNPDYQKLLKYCLKNAHWSVFEQAAMTVEITTSRAISAQILRHKSMNFQEFCISGDSAISCVDPSGNQKRIKIEKLYKWQFDKKWSRQIKVFDEKSGLLGLAKVKEVFKTGLKEVFLVTLVNGKTIKATKEHKFYTKNGFVQLGDIPIGQAVAVNGILLYQDFNWMQEQKKKSIENGTGVQGIADCSGASYHTIRKWLKIHNLCFTKKEVAEYTDVWNKGLPKESQPRYGKLATDETRAKHSQSAKKGDECNLFKGGVKRKWRQQVFDWQYSRSLAVHTKFNNACAYCQSTQDLEIDHIVAVQDDPDLAFEFNNLQILCALCHKKKSNLERKKTIKWSKIESVVSVGFEETYDLEVEHSSHNYVANGIIVHNSQRYAAVTSFETYEARRQDTKNRQNSIDDLPESTKQWFNAAQNQIQTQAQEIYDHGVSLGIAKEQMRFILPMSATTTLYMNGTVRSWLTYFMVRLEKGTQKEHRDIANAAYLIFRDHYPVVAMVFEDCYQHLFEV